MLVCIRTKEQIAEVLASRSIDRDGCRLWQGSYTQDGYGRLRWNGERVTHRIAYILANGPIDDDLQVLHRCDTPACIRPDHLFLGTHTDNMKDMVAKRRSNYGVRNGGAKLTPEQVIEMRRLYATQYYSHADLAVMYDISETQVRRILSGRKWPHLPVFAPMRAPGTRKLKAGKS